MKEVGEIELAIQGQTEEIEQLGMSRVVASCNGLTAHLLYPCR